MDVPREIFRTVESFDGFTEAVLESSSGYSITVPTDNATKDDFYTFTASSGTSIVGNLNGGGGNASAGPVTLPALPVVDLGNGYIT